MYITVETDTSAMTYMIPEGGLLDSIFDGLLAKLRSTSKGAFITLTLGEEIYAQACWDAPDVFTVEYRDGSATQHYQSTMKNPEEVLMFFRAWINGFRPIWPRVNVHQALN